MINVGDLVAVVKALQCCGKTDEVGSIFTVSAIETGPALCKHCRAIVTETLCMCSDGSGVEIGRLKKFDPLPESETKTKREEITA